MVAVMMEKADCFIITQTLTCSVSTSDGRKMLTAEAAGITLWVLLLHL